MGGQKKIVFFAKMACVFCKMRVALGNLYFGGLPMYKWVLAQLRFAPVVFVVTLALYALGVL